MNKGFGGKNKGITLIALVISIIVLLILAGISITMLSGENGILKRAGESKVKTEEAEEKEGVQLAVTSSKMEDVSTLEITEDNLKNALKNQFGENANFSVTNNGDGSFTIRFNDTDRIYYIESTGNIIEDENILKISTEDELNSFRDEVNNGNTFEGKIVGLLNNIQLTQDWIPIGQVGEEEGDNYQGLGTNYFKGTFLGNGYYIENININLSNLQEDYNHVGFFSKSFENIKNLELKNVNINVSISSGIGFIGALAGWSGGNIENCKADGKIEVTSDSDIRLGGIVGQKNNKKILNVSSDMQITVSKSNSAVVGGIVGFACNNMECQNSYNEGNLLVQGVVTSTNVGGVVGNAISCGSIKNLYNIGVISVESQRGYTGGVFGFANSVKECENLYNLGNINIKMDNSSFTGGIGGVTSTKTELNNVYNLGIVQTEVVTPNNSFCGGIVGDNISSKINNVYNIGNIIYGNMEYVGGIVGASVNSDSEIKNSYYNNNSIKAYGKNTGYIDDNTVNYTTQMPDILEIINQENAFKQDVNNINQGYPILNWQ